MQLYPLSWYVHELRAALPDSMFRPATSRLLLVPLYAGIIVLATIAIATSWGGWPVALLLSLVIGVAFASLVFLAHELLHGAVVRGRHLKYMFGWICFLPFNVSPRLWVSWHVRAHHAHANQVGRDPDVYPTLERYRASRMARFTTDAFSLGGGRLRGMLSLLLGFTVKHFETLASATTNGLLSSRQRSLAILETTLGIAGWLVVGVLVGPRAFALAVILPIVIANVIVMSFILTNHNLSPLTEVNDPLVNGLTVTAPRWIERLTLDFGYHVEHHLFPRMSSRHARTLRTLVRERWPHRYQSMPLGRALRALHRTARVYKDATTLIDPRTGTEFPTLVPGGLRLVQR